MNSCLLITLFLCFYSSQGKLFNWTLILHGTTLDPLAKNSFVHRISVPTDKTFKSTTPQPQSTGTDNSLLILRWMKISLIWSLCFLLIFMIQNVLEKKTNQRNLVANWSLIVRLIILVTDAKNCDAFGSRWNAVVITIWTNVVRRRCLDKVFVVLWWPTSCVYLLAGLSKAKTYETYLIYTGLARIPWLSNCKPGGNPMLLLSSGTGDGPCRMIQNRKKNPGFALIKPAWCPTHIWPRDVPKEIFHEGTL